MPDPDRADEATVPGIDLHRVERHLSEGGVEAALADLARAGADPVVDALALRLRQNAHVLGPVDPPAALGAILVSRLDGFVQLQPAVDAHRRRLPVPYLANRRPLPDQHAALRRMFVVQRVEQSHVDGLVAGPDGTWLAALDTGWQAGSVLRWDVTTGRRMDRISAGMYPPVALAADGSVLVSYGGGDFLAVVEVDTGHVRHRLKALRRFTAVALAHDGTRLFTGQTDGAVRIWDTGTGTVRRAFRAHTDAVTAIAISVDGALLATADRAGVVAIRDGTTGVRRRTLPTQVDAVHALAFAPDSSWLAIGHGAGSGIWDVGTGECRHDLGGHPDGVGVLTVAPDGTWVATATGLSGIRHASGRNPHRGTDVVRVWDPVTGTQRTALTCADQGAFALAAAPDSGWLAVGYGHGQVRVWDPTVVDDRPADPADIRPSAVAPDGSWYAAHVGTGTVEIRDTGTDRVRLAIRADPDIVYSIRISGDGRWLVTTGTGEDVRVWDPGTGEQRYVFTGNGYNPAVAVGTSWLVVSGEYGPIRAWDLDTGTERYAVTDLPDRIEKLTVSPDGLLLIVHCGPFGQGVVVIREAATGAPRHRLDGHHGTVPAVAVAPDGTWLATGQESGTVRIWDTASGTLRHTMEPGIDPGNLAARLTDVAIAADGRWLAGAYNVWEDTIAGWRGSVVVWQAQSGTAVTAMRVSARVDSCRWTPDGLGLHLHGGTHVFAFTLVTTPDAGDRPGRAAER